MQNNILLKTEILYTLHVFKCLYKVFTVGTVTGNFLCFVSAFSTGRGEFLIDLQRGNPPSCWIPPPNPDYILNINGKLPVILYVCNNQILPVSKNFVFTKFLSHSLGMILQMAHWP